jgi:hypothetical protein
MLAGCNGQVAEVPQSDQSDVNPLATGPDGESLSAPPEYVAEALESSGGLSFWMQQKRLRADGVVKLYREDDSFYLTEHDLEVYPWSNAIRIEANEPQARFVWQLADGRYDVVEGNPPLDVSPLAGSYQTYADAVLRIVTAPVRLLDSEAELYREPTPIRIGGQWYQRITAKYGPAATSARGGAGDASVAPYWTDAVYFLNRGAGLIDMIWLGNEATQEFVVARGYDYSDVEQGGLRVPSKVEVFRADADGGIRERLAELDVTGN